MNNRLLVLLLFAGWSVLCWRIYVCRIKQVCPGQRERLADLAAVSATTDISAPVTSSTQEDTAVTINAESVAPVAALRPTPAKKPVNRPKAEPEAPASTGEGHVTIEETANEAIIHFPYNSTRKIDHVEMDKYLTKLASRLKSSGERLLITGHTDGIGDAATNNILALKRAQSIRDILVRKGVSPKSITCRSFGERKPVASDDTPQGRYKNRRAVITIQ